MRKETIILIAEDDEGHYSLIRKNLQRAGVENPILRFPDGQAVLDFLFCPDHQNGPTQSDSYLLLLDIRMPKVDGIEVLQAIKKDSRLKVIPIIMVTTTDDPMEVDRCHQLGCNLYLAKPIDYDAFVDSIRKTGKFFSLLEVPSLEGV
ncbi:MAG: response regulator [Phycisphaerae bacterium]|nr:response regulator [Phycisphaerae bacterium]